MAENFLDQLRTLNRIKPIIICGIARSGTRMLTNLLNVHPNIAIQGEMHARTIEKYFDMINEVSAAFDHYSSRKGHRLGTSWLSTRHMLTHVFLATANKKAAVGNGKLLRFHGIKTPGFERYLDEFEALFEQTPPFYIYCMRSVDKVFQSWKINGYLDKQNTARSGRDNVLKQAVKSGMTQITDHDTDVGMFQVRYEQSLRQAIKIKETVGRRFILFDLDAYISAPNKSRFVYRKIFAKLGFSEAECKLGALNAVKNRNSVSRAGKRNVSDEALEEIRRTLLASRKIAAYKRLLQSPRKSRR